MAVIDFSLIRLAAASPFTPVSVSSSHITLQSADFICTGIRQRSKKVWPHNNRLWEPGISSPRIRTSCCLSNCEKPDWSRNSALNERAFPPTATWNCCHPNNPLLSLVFFSALALWCLNLLRCWKKTHPRSGFWLVGRKKKGNFSSDWKGRKQFMFEHRNLGHACSAPHLWVLALTFCAPSSAKGCTECSFSAPVHQKGKAGFQTPSYLTARFWGKRS